MDSNLRETLKTLVSKLKTYISGEIGDATLTIKQNNTSIGTFTANASSNVDVNITTPTKTSDLENDGEGGSPEDKFVLQSEIVQSDWDERDSLNNGFINNRTHYKTIYDVFTTFNSLTLLTDGTRASASVTLPSLPSDMSWSNDKNWLITFIMGGKEYEYKSFHFSADQYHTTLEFGFESDMGTKTIMVLDIRNNKLSLSNCTNDVTITDVKIIYLTDFKQLHDYYIPNSIARTNDVPNNSNIVNTIKTNGSFGIKMKSATNEDANYELGSDSMAIGFNTMAAGEYQFVFGKLNIKDTNNTYIEIVGNGINTSNRSNARTLDWSGNETLAGSLTVGKNLTVGSSNTPNNGYIHVYNDETYGGGCVDIIAKGEETDPGMQGIITLQSTYGTNGGSISLISTPNPSNHNGGDIYLSAIGGKITAYSDVVDFSSAGWIKGVKKEISDTDCTPDTYYCPQTPGGETAITLDDSQHTGDYNYTFSGYFTNATSSSMAQMPSTTSSNIAVDWFGDSGLESGKKYMFCCTKVSATLYVGVVTKLN